jgi:hypothetical protein
MRKIRAVLSYGLSFLLLLTAIGFSVHYLWNVYKSARKNFRTETVYLTRGDTLQNFYVAIIPGIAAKGMLVLKYISLTPEAYQLAAENGLIVVSAIPGDQLVVPARDRDRLSCNNIIDDAAHRYRVQPDRIVVSDFTGDNNTRINFTCGSQQIHAAELMNSEAVSKTDYPQSLRIANEAGLISRILAMLEKK